MQLPRSTDDEDDRPDGSSPAEGGGAPPVAAAAGGREDTSRRRMTPGNRRSLILEQAAEFFANNGPAASTRALARALGITQALLYRYFPSKDALVRAVYDERFSTRWDPVWIERLRDRSRPLEARLVEFFTVYINRLSAPDYRLWMRAALEGWSFARFYHQDLVENVLTPIIAELRFDAGLEGFAVQPVMYGELEIAFNLHGALTFVRIRRDVYGAPVHLSHGAAAQSLNSRNQYPARASSGSLLGTGRDWLDEWSFPGRPIPNPMASDAAAR